MTVSHMYTKDTKNDTSVLLGNLEKELEAVTGLNKYVVRFLTSNVVGS